MTENTPVTFSATPIEHINTKPLPPPMPVLKSLKGERGRVYIALYPARETPPVFPLPPGTPLPLPGSRTSPAAETTAPAPELLNRPAPAGRGNAQNRHSNSRSPAAATEIFNSPLNLPGKGNCHNLTIAPNISQMLRFAPISSRSLAFFIRRVSFFRYSLGRVYI